MALSSVGICYDMEDWLKQTAVRHRGFTQSSESRLPAALGTRRDVSPRPALSRTVHTPAGGISSASPAEPSAPGRAAERTPASGRPPLESSSVTVSRKVTIRVS